MLLKMFLNCCLLSIIYFIINAKSVVCNIDNNNDIGDLTGVFFNNLEINFNLGFEDALTNETKQFIDKQIGNYMDLVKKRHSNIVHSITRRSLPSDDLEILTKDNSGVFILDGYQAHSKVPAIFPREIKLFTFNENWYAVALECKDNFKQADQLVVYKHNIQNEQFIEINRIPVQNGIKIDMFVSINSTVIVVAENITENNFETKPGVYEFTKDHVLLKIEALNTLFASDVVIWEMEQEIYMAIAQQMSNDSGIISYETKSPIYKWLGRHFDIIQYVDTKGVKKITSFAIKNSHFLAVVNTQDNQEETNVHVEIFKYHLNEGIFLPHQKLSANAPSDVQFLCFKEERQKERFLLVANEYELDINGNRNYETSSIIYKYVDDYFIPFQSFILNGAIQWLPVIGTNGEFLLLVACKFEGVKSFQYDGWRFVETQIQYTDEAFSKGIVSMYSYIHNDKPIIVVSNKFNDGTMSNVFEPTFKHQNHLTDLQEEMQTWCNNALESVQETNTKKVRSTLRKAARSDIDELQFSEAIHFQNITVDNLFTFDIENSEGESDTSELEKLRIVKLELDEQIKLFEEIETNVENLNEIEGDLFADEIIVNDVIFKSLTSQKINTYVVSSILDNSMNITENLNINVAFELNTLKANIISPLHINSHPVKSLVYKDKPFSLNHLQVDGNVILDNSINIGGTLNNFKIQEENILLNQGEQVFEGDLNLLQAEVNKLNTKLINKLKMSEVDILIKKQLPIKHIRNLSVKNVILDGLLNKVDFPTLYKFTLKTFGEQIIMNEFFFENLIVDHIIVEGLLSNIKVTENLIRIDSGSHHVQQDMFFNNITVDEIVISTSLNQIQVINGKLDVLLRNVPYVQHMSGSKQFQNLELLNPFMVQFKIKSKALEKMNPVVIIDNELVVKGDVFVNGNVTVEKLLETEDVKDKNKYNCLKHVLENGIKITDTEIPIHLNFSQQINVEEIFVDNINDVDPQMWVINGKDEVQIIQGPKIFLGDIFITGPTNVVNVNNINIPNLETNTLKINENQIVAGKHFLDNVVANRVTSKDTKLWKKQWKNVLTLEDDQIIEGVTIVNSIKANTLKTYSLVVEQEINNKNFNKMILDTVTYSNISEIEGLKQFVNLNVENIHAGNGAQIITLPDVKNKIVIEQNIKLPDHIEVANIYFKNQCNGLHSKHFGQNWMTKYGDQSIDYDQNFKNVTIYGKVYVNSNHINNINLLDLFDNTVKIDEEHHFSNTVIFEDGLKADNEITIDGNIVGLDLENTVESNSEYEQVITDHVIFNGNVTVEGNLEFNGVVSGLNLSDLCDFVSNYEKSTHLVIDGNAHFAFGPNVQYINTYLVEEIMQNAWYGNENTSITGNIKFENVVFENDVHVGGYVDNVNLKHFSEVYFSKTRNQHVTAKLYFTDDVTFNESISAPWALLKGDINGINLEEFKTTVILNQVEQVFENTLFLENCKILNLDGDYTVNGLNLETDIMRYDMENVVIGKKIVKNLDVSDLTLNNNTKIQNVALLEWFKSTVLNNGSFNIQGRKVFNGNITFSNGIVLVNYLNGKNFNSKTVLLKSADQNVTGLKIINESYPPIHFKNIQLDGYLNNYDFDDVINKQAKKNEDSVFQSTIKVHNDITVNNINLKQMYHGIDVFKLIHNLSQLKALSNYNEKFEKLLNVSHKVSDSLKLQAYFLYDYKVEHHFKDVKVVLPMFNGDIHYLLAVSGREYSFNYYIYTWNENKNKFEQNSDDLHYNFSNPSYINTVDFDGQKMLYVESANNNNEIFTHYGEFLLIMNGTVKSAVPAVLTNGTKFLQSFVNPSNNYTCFMFIYNKWNYPSIFCPYENNIEELKTYGAVTATIVYIQNIPHLIIINKGNQNSEANISVWKYSLTEKHFKLHQEIYVTEPTSVTASFYKGTHYLVIASGHVSNIVHQGLIDIRRFDETTQQFTSWQIFELNAPIQVELAILPSDELVLYVLKEDETEPLKVYLYEGIAGFTLKVTATVVPKQNSIKSFTMYDKHFIIAENHDGVELIQAVFKGNKFF